MNSLVALIEHPLFFCIALLSLKLFAFQWSWLKSVLFILGYHAPFLLFMAYDPELAFAPELLPYTRWLLGQVAALIFALSVLFWYRSYPVPADQQRI